MRQTLAALNLPKTLEVGTSEAGSYFATAVLSGIDYGMANVHPWFANTTIGDAAPWTFNFFAETDVAPAQLVPKPPTMWIAETGWPTQSTGTAATDGRAPDAEPGVPALQTFLDGFLCQANANGTGYFFFEFADEPWKDAQFGGVEGWWGIFNHKCVFCEWAWAGLISDAARRSRRASRSRRARREGAPYLRTDWLHGRSFDLLHGCMRIARPRTWTRTLDVVHTLSLFDLFMLTNAHYVARDCLAVCTPHSWAIF
jgi:hypothetical protein